VEKKYKRKRRENQLKDTLFEIGTNDSESCTVQSTIKNEIDDLDRFIKEIVDTENKIQA